VRSPRVLISVLAAVGALAGPAAAAPPPNDAPAGAAAFEPFTAANGRPDELEALAELAEATPDRGVPRCLGPSSFARTVWYRVPATPSPQELSVEASGRTLDVIDLAAFVQPKVTAGPVTRRPNFCSGAGAGGADAAEEPTSGMNLRVPAGRDVLVEVGRRGPVGSADDERVLVSLDEQLLDAISPPPGDRAYARTPKASDHRGNLLDLSWATTGDEDPAEPSCPSLGSIWRHYLPSGTGPRLVTVRGYQATTLSVYAGKRPTEANELDCVNRRSYGALQMRVAARRGRSLWIRVGTDRANDGARAKLNLDAAGGTVVVNGGPGGFDPTAGGPGGGLPVSCDRPNGERARVAGPRIGGSAQAFSRRSVIPVVLRVRGAALCDVKVELVGPGQRVYAVGRAIRLSGRSVVAAGRTLRFRKGVYRVRVTALSSRGTRAIIRSTISGRLK
jgi:hypothetical protein